MFQRLAILALGFLLIPVCFSQDSDLFPTDYCSTAHPEFGFRGPSCCLDGAIAPRFVKVAGKVCAPYRRKSSYCDEKTESQKAIEARLKNRELPNALDYYQMIRNKSGVQTACSGRDGFLSQGLPLLPSPDNRISLRNEGRCTYFGTDSTVMALEWMGQQINKEYFEPEFKSVRLTVADISAPQGSCISGRRGREGHVSHRRGEDVDARFFNVIPNHSNDGHFTKEFLVASNWYFLKTLVKNPYACVRSVFLDQKHIRLLEKYQKQAPDSDWKKIEGILASVKGHKNHFHIRFGSHPGIPGCGEPKDTDEQLSEESAEGLDDDVARAPADQLATSVFGQDIENSEKNSVTPDHKREPLVTQALLKLDRRRKGVQKRYSQPRSTPKKRS